MPRSFHFKWAGLLALTLTPRLLLAQAAAPETHTVREGDTLWDLAKHYRGDPFLWPDLYRMNTAVVEDPHWIYPGEVLRLAGGDSIPSVPTTDTPEPAATAVAAPAPADSAPAEVVSAMGTADQTDAPPQQTLAQLTTVSANDSDDDRQGLFGPKPTSLMQASVKAYNDQPYRALRRSEFYSSGFLTENQRLPFGLVLGPVTPQQVRANGAHANAMPYSTIAVEAPHGATYQIGDTLLVATLGAEIDGYGQVVMPTGLVRIVDTVQGRYVATVAATYGPIRNGQRVLPAEKFTPSGNAHAVPLTEGVQATFVGGIGRQDLKAPQMVVFLNKGREDGVAAGDLFEIRRRAERTQDGRQLINEVMATMQIVHVRDHTSTARLINILSPDIAPGSGARQVAKLPS